MNYIARCHPALHPSARRLAAFVTHQLNNKNGAISGNADWAKTILSESPHPDPSLAESIEDIRKSSCLLEITTKQLTETAGVGLVELKITVVSRAVKKTIDSLRQDFAKTGHSIDFTEKTPPQLMIKIDVRQLDLIVYNLLINAQAAMPSGGNINMAIEELNVAIRYRGSHDQIGPGHYVTISATDSGTSISPDEMSNIFDPFTKARGLDLELTLASTWNIVHNYQGYITVLSGAGSTTFTVFLPLDKPAEGSV